MHVEMPMWMFLKAMRTLGISRFEQLGIRAYVEDHKRGAFELGAPTDHVLHVTGREPEEFETIARRYAAMPQARRSLANTLKTFGTFMKIGMTPAYNLDAYERDQQHPRTAKRELAVDSRWWRERLEPRAMGRLAQRAQLGSMGCAEIELSCDVFANLHDDEAKVEFECPFCFSNSARWMANRHAIASMKTHSAAQCDGFQWLIGLANRRVPIKGQRSSGPSSTWVKMSTSEWAIAPYMNDRSQHPKSRVSVQTIKAAA